jgi:hypothetical protein
MIGATGTGSNTGQPATGDARSFDLAVARRFRRQAELEAADPTRPFEPEPSPVGRLLSKAEEGFGEGKNWAALRLLWQAEAVTRSDRDSTEAVLAVAGPHQGQLKRRRHNTDLDNLIRALQANQRAVQARTTVVWGTPAAPSAPTGAYPNVRAYPVVLSLLAAIIITLGLAFRLSLNTIDLFGDTNFVITRSPYLHAAMWLVPVGSLVLITALLLAGNSKRGYPAVLALTTGVFAIALLLTALDHATYIQIVCSYANCAHDSASVYHTHLIFLYLVWGLPLIICLTQTIRALRARPHTHTSSPVTSGDQTPRGGGF